MKNIRGILFDKDGTLIEADATWIPLYRRMLIRMKGVDEAEADRLLSLTGYDVASGKAIGGSVIAGGTTRQLVDIWWPDASEAERGALTDDINNNDKHATDIVLTPIVELAPLLDALKSRGIRIGIATNDSHASASRHMRQLGISDYFEAILTSDTVPTPKPSGDMIRRFSEITGLAVNEIAMVGDNHHDIEEARNGGAGLSIAVLSGNGDHDQLAHIADITLPHVGDLLALLEET
jgi:phosphoglycolate phosphatase